MHYQTLNAVSASLVSAGMPQVLWGEYLNYVVAAINVTNTKALCGKTPHEVQYGKKPDVSKLKPFGCVGICFVSKKREKLNSTTEVL